MRLPKNKHLIIITGPSGVGKSTIARALLKEDKKMKRLVTFTTRKKRKGERNKRDYNFVSRQEFKKMIENKELFEWAVVYENFYGNSRKELEKAFADNDRVIMVLDIQGAFTVQKEIAGSVSIFVAPDTIENLIARIEARCSLDRDDFCLRLKQAKQELRQRKKCDHVVINKEGRLARSVERVKKIIDHL